MSTVRSVKTKIQNLPRSYALGGIVVLAIVALVGYHFVTRVSSLAALPPQVTHVELASVASLSSATGPLPVTGKVASLSDAVILAESSGQIVSLSRSLGSFVTAGSVIAQFDSSSQTAALQQAQGAYDAASAALAKARGSTAANSTISSSQASTAAQNAASAASVAIQSAYASLDDAVHTKADTLFSNPRSQSPTFNLTIPDSQLAIDIVGQRVQIEAVLNDAQALADASQSADTDASISSMLADAQKTSDFIDSAVKAVNQVQPSRDLTAATIASYQTSIGLARTEVVSAISSLTSAKTAYDAAQSGAQTAANTATGGTENDIAAAEANVQQALGALNGAKANLEKTVIRSPISGTIVSLAITQGGYVSAFSKVAEVSNPSALEIETYVTSSDAKQLSVGGRAVIDGDVQGSIVSIAPALDPTTNKIEVKIGIAGDQSALTDGETVSVELDRSAGAAAGGGAKTSAKTPIVIPIVAAKITPQGPVVFTVSSSTLVASPITLGAIQGDKVEVIGGLTPETAIVTDARGLSNGQTVVVDGQ